MASEIALRERWLREQCRPVTSVTAGTVKLPNLLIREASRPYEILRAFRKDNKNRGSHARGSLGQLPQSRKLYERMKYKTDGS